MMPFSTTIECLRGLAFVLGKTVVLMQVHTSQSLKSFFFNIFHYQVVIIILPAHVDKVLQVQSLQMHFNVWHSKTNLRSMKSHNITIGPQRNINSILFLAQLDQYMEM